MSASVSKLCSPPPRASWEEPPPAGWGSHLGGLGLEALAIISGGVAAVAAWKLFDLAQRLDADPTRHGMAQALVVGLWSISFLLAAVLGLVLWRLGGGLALVTAMLTDHGRAVRFGGRPPIWLDEPPPGGLRIAHLTDLHITEAEDVRMVEHNAPGGNRAFAALLARPELREADVILITGDVTDRGTELAWQRVRETITAAGLDDRVVLVPGNHDLSIIDPWGGWRDPGRRWRRSDRFGIVQLANLLKFCEVFAVTAGGRRGSVLKGGEVVSFAEAFAACEAEVRALVHDDLPARPIPRQNFGRGYLARKRGLRAYRLRIARARNKLLSLFPIGVPLASHRAVVFVLNSCTPVARHPATNALGRVGLAQHRRLDQLARHFDEPIKLVGLHHHVVRRSEELSHGLRQRIIAKLTVLDDALPLVRFCRKHGVRAVLHGHRHLSYQLRLPNGTVLLAAPSSTMGDQLAHDPRPQFDRYDVAPVAVEPSVGVFRRVIHLSPITAAPPLQG